MTIAKKSFYKISFERNIVIISSFITIYLLNWWLRDTDFSLKNFSNLYVGMATLDGFDVGMRVRLFFKGISLGVILFLIIYFILFRLSKILQLSKSGLNHLLVISANGLLLIFSDVIGLESNIGIQFFLFLFLFTLLLVITEKKISWIKIISRHLHYECILILSFLFSFILLFLFNSTPNVITISIPVYFSIVTLLSVLILFAKHKLNIPPEKIFRFLLPLSLVPLLIFFSIELQFLVKTRFDIFIPYKEFFVVFLGSAFFAFSIKSRRKNSKISLKKMLSYFLAPSALLSFLLLTIYNPVIQQPTEIFELANPANAIMRIFAFGEIPFVDFMTSHMFSEQFYGIIYNLIFGYKGSLDFLTYNFLYETINIFVAWYFTYRLLKNPVFALLVVVLFPFIEIYYRLHLFLSVIVFFAIRHVIQKQNALTYLGLILLVLLFVIFRLDVGVATLFTAVMFLPLYFFSLRIKIAFRDFFKALALASLTILILLIFFSIIRSPEYLWNHIKSAYHYISANQAHGYSLITNNYNQQFYISHLLYPVFSIIAIFYSMYTIRKKGYELDNQKSFMLVSSTFLFLVFLFNFQRGLIRHSYLSGLESYLISTFYIATTLFICSFFKEQTITMRYISFLGVSFFIVVFLKYFSLDKRITYFEKLFTQPTLIKIDSHFNNENYAGRVIGNKSFEEQNYDDLKLFLNKNLNEEQTFLDFSNSPMLYYYCQRRVPSYFCQSLQNTVDDYLQIQHLNRVNPENVPVVIFSNYPPNWFDNTDGVPNVMRQYLIAEYIFMNYKPFGVIDNRSIWINKRSDYSWQNMQTDTLANNPKTYHYKKAAYAFNEYFESSKKAELELITSSNYIEDTITGNISSEINQKVFKIPGIFLKIILNKPLNNKEIEIDLQKEGIVLGTILFTTSEKYYEYMIPLSNHYLWHRCQPNLISIKKTKETEIVKVAFYKDNRIEY